MLQADGRLLYVYHAPASASAYNPASAPLAQRANESRHGGNNVVVDGSNGFEEPAPTSQGFSGNEGGLYSDSLVNNSRNGGAAGGNRRGRGVQHRGRGGR